MISFLRLMQHGDGSLALFNGMGRALPDRLATILAHDESSGAPPLDAPQSGYRRLQAGEALVIVDAGPPPPPAFSGAAHAGCLVLRIFDRRRAHRRQLRRAAGQRRGSRAVSRASPPPIRLSSIEDRSCCRIAARPGRGRQEERIVAGPRDVRAPRRSTGSSRVLELSHDGYAQRARPAARARAVADA